MSLRNYHYFYSNKKIIFQPFQLWDIKQQLLALERHEYLVVHGKLSFGKRWIVMDACCNYSVMHQMNGNIFWLDCSKCKTPEMILQKLEGRSMNSH